MTRMILHTMISILVLSVPVSLASAQGTATLFGRVADAGGAVSTGTLCGDGNRCRNRRPCAR